MGLSNTECFCSVSDRFDLSRSTTHSIFVQLCSAIHLKTSRRIIRWPSEDDDFRAVELGFRNRNGIPCVIGAIDGCHIPIKAPTHCPENYYNRKSFYSVLLQGICDFNMKFTDCYVGWPESVHDSQVLQRSDLYTRIITDKDQLFPSDTYKIGDAVYPLHTWLLTPFRDNGHLRDEQKKYNYIHSSTRMVIERAFCCP